MCPIVHKFTVPICVEKLFSWYSQTKTTYLPQRGPAIGPAAFTPAQH